MTDGESVSHPIMARLYDRLNRGAEADLFPPHREYLAADIHGTVLDIGIGTGAMFPYYAESRGQGADFDLYTIEPDPHMRRRATEAAEAAGLDMAIDDARAESLPYDDGSFDIVICSLVLCSVADLDAALSEVGRVLRADGEFRFFEHISADGLRGQVEELVSPLWRPVAGGCHIDRKTGERIAGRFEVVDQEVLDIGTLDTFPVRRFVRGRATV